ncbi:Glutathione-independent formaldehyde dehydrogenase [Pseudomonas aeruginosa]|nr:formaldehyde dehydrogenase, glutathione-independent [Pseudomonas aeruginosa]VZR95509.1 Glutathione-independent formaldehyde dehydrogenase [Pseudomonas aeruginosa]
MSGNRGVVYLGPGKVEVQNIPYPKMQDPQGRQIDHGVILRVVSTNICGSDQHMVRGRTTAPEGLVLGHEITGEVVEIGRGVETMKIGDLVSVPFNVACGHCRTCKEQHTGVCLTVNPARAGGAYGYVDMGGWVGGQAEYVLVPYADFNLLKLPNREAAMEKIRDLTCLSDILPTGYHGAVTAGVGPGSTVYIAGAGPVGLAAAASARLLGAAVVIVGDVNPTRLAHAKKQGFEIADLSKDTPLHEQIAALLGEPEVDCAVDAVGFEARGHGHSGSQQEAPATVLNSLMGITRVAGKIGIPGLYVTEDPGAVDAAAKHGALSIRFGLGWAKSHSFHTGQTPVMKYNRQLMQAIMWDRIKIADIVGVEVITLDDAPKGYGEFDAGVPKKEVQPPADAGDHVGPDQDRRHRRGGSHHPRRCAERLRRVRRRGAEEIRHRPAQPVPRGLNHRQQPTRPTGRVFVGAIRGNCRR